MAYNRKSKEAEDIVWNGRIYRRTKGHKDRHRREYFMATTAPRTYLHRDRWEHHHKAKIPEGWEVHHKDEDSRNNEPLNLEAMPDSDHMKKHWMTRKSIVKKCEKCGKNFDAFFSRAKWCSPACKESYRREKGLAYVKPKKPMWTEQRICEECGSIYVAKKHWSKFCSNRCRGYNRRKNIKLNTTGGR